MEFTGTERFGLEMFGTMPAADARERTGGNIPLDDHSGRVPVSLTVLTLEGIRPPSVPLKLNYTEVLWRVGVILRKHPAWLIVAVDVDRTLARLMAGFLMSYPTRASSIDVSENQRLVEVAVRTGSVALGLRAELNTNSPPAPDKRMLAARDGARFFKVPWGSASPSSRQGAYVSLTDADLVDETLSKGVTWEEGATVWRSREHRCATSEALALL